MVNRCPEVLSNQIGKHPLERTMRTKITYDSGIFNLDQHITFFQSPQIDLLPLERRRCDWPSFWSFSQNEPRVLTRCFVAHLSYFRLILCILPVYFGIDKENLIRWTIQRGKRALRRIRRCSITAGRLLNRKSLFSGFYGLGLSYSSHSQSIAGTT